MPNLDPLITAVIEYTPEAEAAREKLINMGLPAVEAMLPQIRTSSLSHAHTLIDVILKMTDPKLPDYMLELSRDKKPRVRNMAINFLVKRHDQRVVEPLIELLKPDKPALLLHVPARELGDFKDPKALPALLAVADKYLPTVDEKTISAFIAEALASTDDAPRSRLNLLTLLAESLAKLGDHRLLPYVAHLVKNPIKLIDGDERGSRDIGMEVREKAAQALQYLSGPGLFEATQAVVKDKDPNVRQHAVLQLLYLGAKQAVPELIKLTVDKDSEIAGTAQSALEELVGPSPELTTLLDKPSVRNLEKWWQSQESRFKEGICYRLGEPLDIAKVIELLKRPQRWSIVSEITTITGVESWEIGLEYGVTPPDDRDGVFKAYHAWYEKNGAKFEVGQLYKYGFKQDLVANF